jgi:lipopolysaccharide biosynthesis glycosyltransferase
LKYSLILVFGGDWILKFNIALAFDSQQEEFSIVLISNIIKKSNARLIHFHLFVSEQVNYDKYNLILDELNVNYSIYVIKERELKDLHNDKSIYGWISNATFYRLFIPEKIPNDIDWILYLDIDIWVTFDIIEIFGLIDNSFPLVVAQKNSRMGFNAGVMLINCNLFRKQLPSKKSIEEIKKNSFPGDNEFLIYYFSNNTGSVDLTYNFPVYFYTISLEYLGFYLNSPFRIFPWLKKHDFGPKIDDAKIIHFMGPWKPWSFFTVIPFANEWREEYRSIFSKHPWHKTSFLVRIHKSFNRLNSFYLRLINNTRVFLKITGLHLPLARVKSFLSKKKE